MTEKRRRWGALWITGSAIVLLAGALLFHRPLAVAYHAARLRGDAGYLSRLADAPVGSSGAQALSAYLETAVGREHLCACVVREMLDDLTGDDVETITARLDPTAWSELELEVRRLHYGSPSEEEWWIVYTARDAAGREATGSARASSVLVALERRLTAVVEPGGAEPFALAAWPDLEFELRPSEVEEGEWQAVGRREEEADG